MDRPGLWIINFSLNAIDSAQQAAIEARMGATVMEEYHIALQMDFAQPFEAQVRTAVNQIPLSRDQWKMPEPLIVVILPGLHTAAAVLIAELIGRMGHLPSIVRFGPAKQGMATRYEVMELINLQDVRDQARLA